MKFTVEFYVAVLGIWDSYDEFYNMDADSAVEAIDLCIEWMVEHDARRDIDNVDDLRVEYENWGWRAAELVTNEFGATDHGEWVVK